MGNTAPNDGYTYRGRGLLQLTGKASYQEATATLRRDNPDAPDFVAAPRRGHRRGVVPGDCGGSVGGKRMQCLGRRGRHQENHPRHQRRTDWPRRPDGVGEAHQGGMVLGQAVALLASGRGCAVSSRWCQSGRK